MQSNDNKTSKSTGVRRGNRRIVLMPDPELARAIDAAAAADRRNTPQWIFSLIDRALAAQEQPMEGAAR